MSWSSMYVNVFYVCVCICKYLDADTRIIVGKCMHTAQVAD